MVLVGEVDHRRVEAVDGSIVGVEWPSVEAEPAAEGIEDAVAVVGGNGDGVAVAVGNGAVAGVGLAAVPVVIIPVAYYFWCAVFSGEFRLGQSAGRRLWRQRGWTPVSGGWYAGGGGV